MFSRLFSRKVTQKQSTGNSKLVQIQDFRTECNSLIHCVTTPDRNDCIDWTLTFASLDEDRLDNGL